LDHGADINATDKLGKSLLFWSVVKKVREEEEEEEEERMEEGRLVWVVMMSEGMGGLDDDVDCMVGMIWRLNNGWLIH